MLQREVVSSSKVAVLPSTYQSLPAQAVEYSLACVQLPKDVSVISVCSLPWKLEKSPDQFCDLMA